MEIIVKSKPLSIIGEVDVKVYDPEDLANMEPKVNQVVHNSTSDYILGYLTDLMHGNVTTQSTEFITTDTNWFDQPYPGINTSGSTPANNDGKNGIVAVVDRTTGSVKFNNETEAVKHFFLTGTKSTSTSNNVTSWTAQQAWTGGTGSSACEVSNLELGKNYEMDGQDTSLIFVNQPFASADNVDDFNLAIDDILKVTWTITIG